MKLIWVLLVLLGITNYVYADFDKAGFTFVTDLDGASDFLLQSFELSRGLENYFVGPHEEYYVKVSISATPFPDEPNTVFYNLNYDNTTTETALEEPRKTTKNDQETPCKTTKVAKDTGSKKGN